MVPSHTYEGVTPMHRRLAPSAVAVLAGLLLVGCTQDNTGPVEDTGSVRLAPAPMMSVGSASSSYLILGKGNKLPKDLAAKVSQAGGTLTASVSAIGVATATSSSADFQTKASAISGVEAVALDQVVQWVNPNEQVVDAGEATASDDVGAASLGDDETFFNASWLPKSIHAPEAWDLGALGTGVRVAVLDGGLNDLHIDLNGSVDVARSASFVSGFFFNQDVPGFSTRPMSPGSSRRKTTPWGPSGSLRVPRSSASRCCTTAVVRSGR